MYLDKMIRVKTLTVWLLTACATVQALPTACSEHAHCPSDSFCDASLLCRECLRCDTFKREPPQAIFTSTCIRTVTQCGSCFKGLVENGGNVCVSPRSAPKGRGDIAPPQWVAIVIGFAALLALLLCVIAAYMLRDFRTFKIFAPTRTPMHSTADRSLTPARAANDPLPPPYNAAAIPPSDPHTVEESLPFIKMVAPSQPDTRLSDGCQAARVFSCPAYVRGPELPPSYDTSEPIDETHEPLAPIQDENSSDSVNTNVNAATFHGATMNSAAAVTAPSSPTQDSNNNSGEENTDHNRSNTLRSPSFLAQGSSAVVINVTTVQAHNSNILSDHFKF